MDKHIGWSKNFPLPELIKLDCIEDWRDIPTEQVREILYYFDVVSGATRWLTAEQALIQLTLHYDTDEQLWFSFFHEAGHILLHDKQDIFLQHDGTHHQAEKEQQANRFAADMLIPPRAYQRFMAKKAAFCQESIQIFAKQLGIAPCIVVGRLQHDGHLALTDGNELKRRLLCT